MNRYICCCRIVLTAFMLAICVSSATFADVSDFGRVEQRRGRYKKINGSWYDSTSTQPHDLKLNETDLIIGMNKPCPTATDLTRLLRESSVHRANEFAVTYLNENSMRSIFIASVPGDIDVLDALDDLRGTNIFDSVSPSPSPILDFTPDDPLSGATTAWHLDRIEAYEAWDITTGSDNVLVGVIDPDGVDQTHATNSSGDLALNYDTDHDWDYEGNDSDPWADVSNDVDTDYYSGYNWYSDPAHGTACIGIIGATTDNTRGVAGVAGGNDPTEGVRVTMCRFDGLAQHASAIQNLADPNIGNADVISCSYSYSVNYWNNTLIQAQRDAIINAIQSARDDGALVVFSTGNTSSSAIRYPAALTTTIAVGASDEANDQRCNFSNYGTGLDIVAPGEDIPTTDLWGKYGYNGYEERSINSTDHRNEDFNPDDVDDEDYTLFSGTSAAVP